MEDGAADEVRLRWDGSDALTSWTGGEVDWPTWLALAHSARRV